MDKWLFLFIIILFSAVVAICLTKPLKLPRSLNWAIVFIFILTSMIIYSFFGGYVQWQNYLRQQERQVLAQSLLKSAKSPEEIIEKLRNKLSTQPQSAKGWYLLGRLYATTNQHSEALKAFNKAHELNPRSEQYTVNYIYALWQNNNQKFNASIVSLLQQLLTVNPMQPDALALLAMNAFEQKNYLQAINYWQNLLKLAGDNSDEAQSIRQAIAKAEQLLRNQKKE
ncbi:MAG: hypothetical protein BGO90_07055 [Legionella sp. 40-6]|nr:tetratricopeptide repeat protein [Legionella sp.]OJY37836.1 MAG: hypothetical protein BGO90_07055 [Legionella sp. 40-6]